MRSLYKYNARRPHILSDDLRYAEITPHDTERCKYSYWSESHMLHSYFSLPWEFFGDRSRQILLTLQRTCNIYI